jgi:hypothetical protein
MPASIEELARSLDGIPRGIVQRIAAFLQASGQPFRELVDPALELLAGVVPAWPLLDRWNEWALANHASFFVWQPHRAGQSDRQRLEALLHTIMMLAGKEQGLREYRDANVAAAEVVMAGDDCVICDAHRHRVVPLSPAALAQLAPFHPGCRCGILPHLD